MNSCCELCRQFKELKKQTLNVLELYSGIGGMRYGLLGCGQLAEQRKLNVTAIDISPNCNAVYQFNFGNESTDDGDRKGPLAKNLASITARELDQLGPFDVVTMSCPCQPFTRQHANQQLEEQDARTESFTNLVLNVLPSLAVRPRYFLIENVKNFEQSKACERVLAMFDAFGFSYRQFLLQPLQFGIPNSRLRYYCLAKEGEFCFSNEGAIVREYPRGLSAGTCTSCLTLYFGGELTKEPDGGFRMNEAEFELKTIEEFLTNETVEPFELKPETVQKYLPAIDVVRPASRTSNCFTGAYGHYLTGTGSFLLLNDVSSEQLAELKKTDADRSGIRLRKFAPREIANLMGFPSSFHLPEHLTLKQSYKLLGNSVNVRVISCLFKILLSNESV